ncbi:hypothetical protein Ocin01_10845 [Orchesella cincta]|uniref:Uncharacterized protein n=1 Tax=Orchesella cincta TaxID=48709 RepID=A0A1D2MST4_ORCCI|nr:hypothetical protein Ocin01_10845 [Orchesella cincta]
MTLIFWIWVVKSTSVCVILSVWTAGTVGIFVEEEGLDGVVIVDYGPIPCRPVGTHFAISLIGRKTLKILGLE